MSGYDGFYCQGAHDEPCGADDCYVPAERERARRIDEVVREREHIAELLYSRWTRKVAKACTPQDQLDRWADDGGRAP